MKYGARELFAEMYAQATLTPEALYGDFVAAPTQAAAKAEATVTEDQARLDDLPKQNADAATIAKAREALDTAQAQARTAELATQQ